MTRWALIAVCLLTGGIAGANDDREQIRLPADLALSSDGSRLAFAWDGDVWIASSRGGRARPLTNHPAEDRRPCFSPDGRTLAFESDRDGPRHVYTMPAGGGIPRRLTAHSEGTTPLEWTPDAREILCRVTRDYGGLDEERLILIHAEGGEGERVVVDAYAHQGAMSPDGRRVLMVREGVEPLRKGYRGSKAAQIWVYDRETDDVEWVGRDPTGCRAPLWKPNGESFYFVSGHGGCFNLWAHDFSTGRQWPLTSFEDDGVIGPRLSRDGSILVFRRGFDVYRFEPASSEPPAKLELWHAADRVRPRVQRRWLRRVWNQNDWGSLDWTSDGRQMTFTAGGDVYIMDTVLREPRPVARGTAPYETEAVFTENEEHILMLRDWGDRTEIWRATRSDPERSWWRNRTYSLEPVITNRTAKANLSASPDGRSMAYAEHGRDLVVADLEGGNRRVLYHAVDMPYYDWSPDGRWMVCSFQDSFDNWDVWIVSVTGEAEPYNLSRRPSYDAGARWSPDGRMIVFTGERGRESEIDLFYVYLHAEEDQRTRRDRRLVEALETVPDRGERMNGPSRLEDDESSFRLDAADLDGLHDRVRRISIPGSRETSPFWRHDARTVGFTSTLSGRRETYQIRFPDALEPERITSQTGYYARWIETDNMLLWLSEGIPHAFTTAYPFQVYQTVDLSEYRRLAFRQIWRTLADQFFDPEMNGTNWDAMLSKYEDVAAAAPDHRTFAGAVDMLLGELNASHAGFELQEEIWDLWHRRDSWEEETAHLGVQFDPSYPGPGWRIRRILEDGPADREPSRLHPGEVVLAVDERPVGRELDLPTYLNGPLDRTISLTVQDGGGEVRRVGVRPISYETARRLQRDARFRRNRGDVQRRSQGALAYIHVDRMEWADVERFEAELFSIADGAEGLLIDVRNNQGGFAADYLLAMLCRPRHAITVPRAGVASYPRDYAGSRSWDRPLAVLCNQFTASNGEIFAHAIQGWGRGKVVGVPTRGAVISKVSRPILDLGRLDVPHRGWFRASDGSDLELNGVQPDVLVWPLPGEIPRGVDRQLEAAVGVLMKAVRAVRPAEPRREPRESINEALREAERR